MTAVEVLFNIWLNREYITEDEWSEAMEMEKEQEEKTYSKAFNAGYDNATEYYNETFKSE